ncbi:hypothetical protein EJ02DRAFT_98719 [Clathrospora elynae]|uniref:Uncharacterized protein n=1 Tax=Clathrospora elynae TaxID=706981 RepID=A0A6A5SVS2_9PLEO|nr:hypothetical protein EJ02DRAFT_98719 [Clathrospora elynae]
MTENDVHQAYDNPQPILNTYSPLLRLSAELRNDIYQYVLTPDCKLFFSEAKPGRKARVVFENGDEHQEFNQIKYVCRQLYAETAGLEAKYNMIYVHGSFPRGKGPAQKFSEFLATCSRPRVSWFRNVLLSTSSHYNMDSFIEPANFLFAIADFCRNNPDAAVVYSPRAFDSRSRKVYTFVLMGVYLTMAVRNKIPSCHIPMRKIQSHEGYMRSARQWTDKQGIARMDVPNLRFWPAVELAPRFVHDASRKSGGNSWVAHVREWMENDI